MGDCHVRFCERLRGAIPLDLLGGEYLNSTNNQSFFANKARRHQESLRKNYFLIRLPLAHIIFLIEMFLWAFPRRVLIHQDSFDSRVLTGSRSKFTTYCLVRT
jgi:hypothetical protein